MPTRATFDRTMTLPPFPPGHAPALRSPEFGLAMGLVLGRHLIGMEDLHYGFWTDDLPLDIRNLPLAQARYTEALLADIPDGVRRILDVGMGAGNTARKLVERGYDVDGVSPNAFLTGVARQVLGERVRIFECKFEEVATDRRYDLILFSESFLFMQPDAALAKAASLLADGGYILICDIFKLPAEGKSPIGGGKELAAFRATMARYPFDLVRETDISRHIAPTFDLLDRAYREAIQPAYDLVMARLDATRPWLMRFARWWFRARLAKLEAKHFGGRRTGANFLTYKSYRRFLFRKRAAAASAAA
jgi:SAM-dependent methyltransferase